MIEYEKRCYYKRNMNYKVICIKHGVTGYYDTDIVTDEEMSMMNSVNCNTDAEIDAAEICSMFDTWHKFDDILSKLNESKQTAQEG